MKSRLSKIVTGEYITTPIINFLSQALYEKHQSFISSMFKNAGVISSCGAGREYTQSLNVEAGVGNNAKILAGSFIDRDGTIVNVPETQTDISVTQETMLFIRHEESFYLPDVTISGEAGSFLVEFSNASILEYIEPGMSIATRAMIEAGDTQGLEILTVGDKISLKSPLLESFTDQEVCVIPRFYAGFRDEEAVKVYRFDKFAVADVMSMPTGYDFSDWVLLAVVTYENGQYLINNLRAQSIDEIPEDLDYTISQYLPNVASLSTIFSIELESKIINFFTDGKLKIGDEEKDIFGNSHEQNTDVGTSNAFFDIATSKGKMRIGDEGDRIFITRLYSDFTDIREYKLPSGEQKLSDSTIMALASLSQSQEYIGAQSIRPARTNAITNKTLTLDGNSNFYEIPSGGILQNIIWNGTSVDAKGNNVQTNNIYGQFVVLRPNADLLLTAGGNIVSSYIASSTASLEDEDVFIVKAGEPVGLLNMFGNWIIVGAAMSVWQRFAKIKQQILTLESNTTTHFKSVEDAIAALTDKHNEDVTIIKDRLAGLDQGQVRQDNDIATLKGSVATNTADISYLKTLVAPISGEIGDITGELKSLWEELEKVKNSAIPKGIILPLDIDNGQISEYFTDTGAGKEGGIFEAFHICNGSNGTPNMMGRQLVMANQFTGASSSFPKGTGGGVGITWPSTAPGELNDGMKNPILELAGSTGRMIGSYAKTLSAAEIPAHRHNFATMDDGAPWDVFANYGINHVADTGRWGSEEEDELQWKILATSTVGESKGFYMMNPSYVVLFIKKIK